MISIAASGRVTRFQPGNAKSAPPGPCVRADFVSLRANRPNAGRAVVQRPWASVRRISFVLPGGRNSSASTCPGLAGPEKLKSRAITAARRNAWASAKGAAPLSAATPSLIRPKNATTGIRIRATAVQQNASGKPSLKRRLPEFVRRTPIVWIQTGATAKKNAKTDNAWPVRRLSAMTATSAPPIRAIRRWDVLTYIIVSRVLTTEFNARPTNVKMVFANTFRITASVQRVNNVLWNNVGVLSSSALPALRLRPQIVVMVVLTVVSVATRRDSQAIGVPVIKSVVLTAKAAVRHPNPVVTGSLDLMSAVIPRERRAFGVLVTKSAVPIAEVAVPSPVRSAEMEKSTGANAAILQAKKASAVRAPSATSAAPSASTNPSSAVTARLRRMNGAILRGSKASVRKVQSATLAAPNVFPSRLFAETGRSAGARSVTRLANRERAAGDVSVHPLAIDALFRERRRKLLRHADKLPIAMTITPARPIRVTHGQAAGMKKYPTAERTVG